MGDCFRNPSQWRPQTPSPPPEPTLFLPQLTEAPLIHLCLPFVVSMGMLLMTRHPSWTWQSSLEADGDCFIPRGVFW